MKNGNDAIRNRISDFDKRRISQPINKLAKNNRRLLIADVFHFVRPVEKDSWKHHKLSCLGYIVGFKLGRWQINYFRLTFWVEAGNKTLNVTEYFCFHLEISGLPPLGEKGDGGGVRGHSRLLTFEHETRLGRENSQKQGKRPPKCRKSLKLSTCVTCIVLTSNSISTV